MFTVYFVNSNINPHTWIVQVRQKSGEHEFAAFLVTVVHVICPIVQ